MASPQKRKRVSTKSERLPTNVALESEKQEKFEEEVKNIKKRGTEEIPTPGVVYLGRIPHGFYEEQMKKFFSQFGTVNRLKLFRSRNTGKSRGYAFIEFQYEEVAKIVAETMHNYLMFERLVQCRFVPKSEVHPKTFSNWNKPFVPRPSFLKAVGEYNKPKSDQQIASSMKRFMKKNQRRQEKLAALGIDFNFPGLEEIEKEKDQLLLKIHNSKNKKPEVLPSKQKSSNKNSKSSIPYISTKKKQTSKSGEIAVLKRESNIQDTSEIDSTRHSPTDKKKTVKVTSDSKTKTRGVKRLKSGPKKLKNKEAPKAKKSVKRNAKTK